MDVELFKGELGSLSLHVIPAGSLTKGLSQSQLAKLMVNRVRILEDSAGMFVVKLREFTGELMFVRNDLLGTMDELAISNSGDSSVLNTVKEETDCSSSLEASFPDLHFDQQQQQEIFDEMHMPTVLENSMKSQDELTSSEIQDDSVREEALYQSIMQLQQLHEAEQAELEQTEDALHQSVMQLQTIQQLESEQQPELEITEQELQQSIEQLKQIQRSEKVGLKRTEKALHRSINKLQKFHKSQNFEEPIIEIETVEDNSSDEEVEKQTKEKYKQDLDVINENGCGKSDFEIEQKAIIQSAARFSTDLLSEEELIMLEENEENGVHPNVEIMGERSSKVRFKGVKEYVVGDTAEEESGKKGDKCGKENDELRKKDDELPVGKEDDELGKEDDELGKDDDEFGKEDDLCDDESSSSSSDGGFQLRSRSALMVPSALSPKGRQQSLAMMRGTGRLNLKMLEEGDDSNPSRGRLQIGSVSLRSIGSSSGGLDDETENSFDGDDALNQRRGSGFKGGILKATKKLRALQAIQGMGRLNSQGSLNSSVHSDLDGGGSFNEGSKRTSADNWKLVAAPIVVTRALRKSGMAVVDMSRKGVTSGIQMSQQAGMTLIEKSKQGINVVQQRGSIISPPRWNLFTKSVDRKCALSGKSSRRSSLRDLVLDHKLPDYDPPTKLHDLCRQSEVKISELEFELDYSPYSVSVRDSKGRLPLHILGDNDDLISTPLGKTTATTFARQLMKAYPEGITCTCEDGFMPFVKMLSDWHNWIYETHQKGKQSVQSNPEKYIARGQKGIFGALGGIGEEITSTIAKNSCRQSDDSIIFPGAKQTSASVSTKSFPPVDLWEEVEWSFQMLSYGMEELGGRANTNKPSRRQLANPSGHNSEARKELASHVVSMMPNLLKTLLLLEDEGEDTRKKLFKTQIIRRILLCPESIGPWITAMMRRKGVASKRVIDYLIILSKTNIEDFLGHNRTFLNSDVIDFREEKDKVFAAVDALPGTIASLVVLDQKNVERAATTSVVWYIMSANLSRPFVVSLVMVDFVLHITLLLAFRTDVSLSGGGSGIGDVPSQVVYFVCIHYLIRKACEAMSLLSLSMGVFRSYFTNIWTIFDAVAIVLTIIATSWGDAHPNDFRNGLNAFVLGLLWLKVLGFLKVVNKQMATFILALIQILTDLKYFGVVLIVIVFMFADMMRIAVSTKDNGQFCVEHSDAEGGLSGPLKDMCSLNPADSYLRIYSVVIGDFELSDYQETLGMLLLFIIVTLMGVVIMLNVLIAVISDSYEKAKIESALLFGRARVTFVAQNQALEQFLRPGTNPIHELKVIKSPGTAIIVVGRLLRWFVLISLLATAMYAEVYLCTRVFLGFEDRNTPWLPMLLLFMIVVVLTAALWVLVYFTLGGVIQSVLPDRFQSTMGKIDKCTDALVKFIANRLFGLSDSANISDDGAIVEEEWSGRLTYMERAFERTVQESNLDLKAEIIALEKRIYAHDDYMFNEKLKGNWNNGKSEVAEAPTISVPASNRRASMGGAFPGNVERQGAVARVRYKKESKTNSRDKLRSFFGGDEDTDTKSQSTTSNQTSVKKYNRRASVGAMPEKHSHRALAGDMPEKHRKNSHNARKRNGEDENSALSSFFNKNAEVSQAPKTTDTEEKQFRATPEETAPVASAVPLEPVLTSITPSGDLDSNGRIFNTSNETLIDLNDLKDEEGSRLEILSLDHQKAEEQNLLEF